MGEVSLHVFTVILLVLSASCLAELVQIRGALRDHSLAISSHDGSPAVEHFRFLPPIPAAHADAAEDLELLDISVVASVDGKLHALNRTSGRVLWSMASLPTSSSPPEAFKPLVRTEHVEYDPDTGETEHCERYIIEPQTGDIYVLPTPDATLHRLPYSMSQLVDMSPFSFLDDNRLFVGRKETSLLVIELETGRVKRTVDSTCPWNPFEDQSTPDSAQELDLDELDGTKPSSKRPVYTEVSIGRTDYYVSIFTKSSHPSQKHPVQSLAFSAYGPNKQDQFIQANYRKTRDDLYMQPLSTGEILSFKTSQGSDGNSDGRTEAPIWGISLGTPIVAVFDVLRSPSREHPLVLLQPHPRVQELLPGFDFNNPSHSQWLSNLDATYIGIVEDNGALFAMSPEQYPLVVFQSNTPSYGGRRGITGSAESDYYDLPDEVDAISHVIKMRQLCKQNPWESQCLTGVRPLGESSADRSKRLLEAEPHDWSTETDGHREESGHGKTKETSSKDPTKFWFSAYTRHSLPGFIFAFIIFIGGYYYRHLAIAQPESKDVNDRPFLPQEGTLQATNEVSKTDVVETLATAATESPMKPMKSMKPMLSEIDSVLRLSTTTETKRAAIIDLNEEPDGDEDSDRDENGVALKKKGTRRRRRGRKGRGKETTMDEPGKVDFDLEQVAETPLATPSFPPIPYGTSSSLVVSDEVLGFGSHGTVVYRGSLQGRAVAVKRLLQDFVTLASREVDILQESDDHPNVIRYFYQEAHGNFLYIALELCPASLADIIERPDQFREIASSFDAKRALVQITSGLRHLHALKIIHRDIKPQNILISSAKKGAGASAGHRMLISDFGLCRKLEFDQTSFLPTAHGAMAAGTVGWRAPEILRREVRLDVSAVDDASLSSQGSVGTVVDGSDPSRGTRLTKAVDIFALGCLFYYTLTSGGHPYGDRFEREMNIVKDAKDFKGLDHFGEEGIEAVDLITAMLHPEAYARPDTTTCLIHPFFWNPARRLAFLQDASDRFEIMCREPREQGLIELETSAFDVVGNDWHSRLDKTFIENLGKFRKYDGKSVQDLMRALRNKKHHYQDLPDNVKRHLGPLPEGFLAYFTRRFPHLFMHVHSVVGKSNLRYESMFKTYYQLSD